ncbi:MAG: EutN/CcmL family microcompartment protein [Actinomycetota bacterium]|nr:EutN/CcmL family microcompartment protein [Actinomycetota bacterium]
MKLVKVVGKVTSTIKDPTLEGFKILLVQGVRD